REEIGLLLLLGFLLGLLLLQEFEQVGRILRRRLAGTADADGRNRQRKNGRHGPVMSLEVPRPAQWCGSRPSWPVHKAKLCRLCVCPGGCGSVCTGKYPAISACSGVHKMKPSPRL